MNNQEFRIEFLKGTRIEQIERACFHLFSIFAALDVDMTHDEHPLHSNTISNFAQIGAAFTDSIYANISEFIEPEEDKEISDAKPDFAGLARKLSDVMRNPALPVDLFNDIMQGINHIHNKSDTEMIDALETAPEYLKGIFEAYHEKYKDEN
jgi:hypothetical protein